MSSTIRNILIAAAVLAVAAGTAAALRMLGGGDGTWTGALTVAAADEPQPAQGRTRRVWVKNADLYTGGPSPDGRSYALTDWDDCDMIIRDLASGDERRLGLTSDDSCDAWGEFQVFSREGEMIAYQWRVGTNNEGGDELRYTRLDTVAPHVLVPPIDGQRIIPQDWTPDGRSVAFVLVQADEPPQLALATIGAAAPRVLKALPEWRAPGAIRMRISPDGRHVAYSLPSAENDGLHDVHVLSLEDGRDAVIFRHIAADYVLGWSADGARLVFASDRGGSPGVWTVPIASGRVAGDARLVRGELWHMHAQRVLPTGDVFYIVRVADSDVFVARLDTEAGTLEPPVGVSGRPGAPHGLPAWSPDGRHLAFITDVHPIGGPGSQVVTIRALDQGEARELRPRTERIGALGWMPGSQALLARVPGTRGGASRLVRLDLQSAETQPFMDDGSIPTFSPDGRRLFYARSETGSGARLVARDVATGNEQVIYTPPPGFAVCCAGAQAPLFTFTPDGRNLIFGIVPATPGNGWMRMLTMPVEGGPTRELFAPAGDSLTVFRILGLSADRSDVVFTRSARVNTGRSFSLWTVPVGGGTPRMIADVQPHIGVLQMSPDGRHVAFPRTTSFSVELWVLEDAGLGAAGGER